MTHEEYYEHLQLVHQQLEEMCKELTAFNTLDDFFEELEYFTMHVARSNVKEEFNQGEH